MNGKTILKHFGIVIISVMLVTGSFVTYIDFADDNNNLPAPEQDHSGQAEALGVTSGIVIGAGLTLAGTYTYNTFVKDASDSDDDYDYEDVNNTANTTTRQNIHTEVIGDEAQTQQILNGFDNSKATLEGQIEQKITQEIINNGTNITSEIEAVVASEGVSSEYLKTGTDNLIKAHNLNMWIVRNNIKEIRTAGYGQDVSVADVQRVATQSELTSAVGSSDIIVLEDDLDINRNYKDSVSGNLDVLDLNGYKINATDGNDGSPLFSNFGTNDGFTIKDGTIDYGGGLVVNSFGQAGMPMNVIDAEISGSLDVPEGNVYISSSNVTGGLDRGTEVSSYQNYPFGQNVTLNTTKIANNNANYDNASDVPTAKVYKNSSVIEQLPAKNITLDQGYYGKNNTVSVAIPYTESGNPVEGNVIFKTPTSGVTDYAVPFNSQRSIDILQERDDIAGQSFDFVENYSRNVWNDWIEPIKNDPDETILTNDTIKEELGQLQTPIDPDNPQTVLNAYTGTYEGTSSPSSDVIHVENTDNGNSYVGALYSTDMNELLDETADPSVVAQGDVLNTQNVTRTLIINQQSGERYPLKQNQTYNVTLIEGKQQAEARTYEQKSTNVAKQARRVQDASETVQRTVEDPTSIPGVSASDDTNSILILAIVAIALLGGGSAGTTVVARRRRGNNMNSSGNNRSSGKS